MEERGVTSKWLAKIKWCKNGILQCVKLVVLKLFIGILWMSPQNLFRDFSLNSVVTEKHLTLSPFNLLQNQLWQGFSNCGATDPQNDKKIPSAWTPTIAKSQFIHQVYLSDRRLQSCETKLCTNLNSGPHIPYHLHLPNSSWVVICSPQ